MDENITMRVVRADGRSAAWEFLFSQSPDGDCLITATDPEDPEGTVWTGSGWMWFDALRNLRTELDAVGCRPLCAGARTNARVSGMLAQMTNGETVYLLKTGRVPSRQAWIFDPADAADVGSVGEQDAFWEHWLESPPGRLATTYSSLVGLLREWCFRLRHR
jgi:hypothetical protein